MERVAGHRIRTDRECTLGCRGKAIHGRAHHSVVIPEKVHGNVRSDPYAVFDGRMNHGMTEDNVDRVLQRKIGHSPARPNFFDKTIVHACIEPCGIYGEGEYYCIFFHRTSRVHDIDIDGAVQCRGVVFKKRINREKQRDRFGRLNDFKEVLKGIRYDSYRARLLRKRYMGSKFHFYYVCEFTTADIIRLDRIIDAGRDCSDEIIREIELERLY